MAKQSYPEKLDEFIFDSLLNVREKILRVYPEETTLASITRSSYLSMQPQEQAQIMQTLGPDWIVKISANIEKKLSEIDKQGAS
jgi:hypothetical protein